MSRNFIAAVLAASITITGFGSVPAQAADAQKVAKVLGTAAVLYIIGKAVSEARADARDEKDREKKARAERERRDAQRLEREGRERESRWARRPEEHGGRSGAYAGHPSAPYLPRPYTPQPRRQSLPGQCLQELHDGRKGAVLMAPCLQRRGISRNDLPRRCQLDVAVGRDVRRAYSERCLQREGFRIASRPHR